MPEAVAAQASSTLLGLEGCLEKHSGLFDMLISNKSEFDIQSYQSEHDRARTFFKNIRLLVAPMGTVEAKVNKRYCLLVFLLKIPLLNLNNPMNR